VSTADGLRRIRLRIARAAVRAARHAKRRGEHAEASVYLGVARYWRARAHGASEIDARCAMMGAPCAWAIRYTTRHAILATRGTRARGWYVGWRLACQLADRRVRR